MNKPIKTILFIAFLLIMIQFIAVVFFSGYYNYGAESVGFSALQRIIDNKPYISDTPSIPFFTNSYNPLLYYALKPFLFFLSPDSLIPMGLLARLLILLLAALNMKAINTLYQSFYTERNSSLPVIVLFVFVILQFPLLFLSFRPDFAATLFEIHAILYFFSEKHDKKSYFTIVTALFFSIAIILKANAISMVISLLLFLLFTGKKKTSLLLGLSVIIITIILFVLMTFVFGSNYLTNTIHAAAHGIIHLSALKQLFNNISKEIIFCNILLYLLSIIGIILMKNKDNPIWKFFPIAIICSFVLASFGQLKQGAYLNYYYVHLFITIVPAALALKEILETETKTKTAIKAMLLCSYSVLGIIHIMSTVQIFVNDYKNYNYKEMKQFIQEKFPEGYIYCTDPNLVIHLYNRTLFGPWTERDLIFSEEIGKNLPAIQTELNKRMIAAVVTMDSKHNKWKPSGQFINHLNKFDYNICSFGKISIFTKKQ